VPGTGFNHCIGWVKLDGKDYYVELTDENLPFGTGDWSVNDAFGVLIPRRGESFSGVAGLINPESRGVNKILREGKVSFSEGSIELHYNNKRVNSVATNLRAVYRDQSEKNKEKSMLESVTGEYAQVELIDFAFDESLDDLTPTLTYSFAYRGVDAKTSIGGMDIYEVAISDRLKNPVYISTAERSLPIDLWQMFDAEMYEQTVSVSAPEGKAIIEIPASSEVENEYVDYKLTYTKTEQGVDIYRYFLLKKDIVAPADYSVFRQDMLKIVEADKITLAFR
jgi:hypothetical protein